MPLARYELYRQGRQIWSPRPPTTATGWLASMRHIAIESGAFVVSVPHYIPAVIAGPLRGDEGIVVADNDLRAGLHAARWFDAVGHSSPAEVLHPRAAGDPGAGARAGRERTTRCPTAGRRAGS